MTIIENTAWPIGVDNSVENSVGQSIDNRVILKQRAVQGLDVKTIYQVNKNKKLSSYRTYSMDTGNVLSRLSGYTIEMRITAPELISVSLVTNTSVNVDWIDNSVNETKFIVQISNDNQRTWQSISPEINRNTEEAKSTGSVIRATVNILPGYNTYFRVVASNSMKSSISNILLLSIKKPNKVSKLNLYYIIISNGSFAKKVNMYIIDVPGLLTEDDFYILSEDSDSISI